MTRYWNQNYTWHCHAVTFTAVKQITCLVIATLYRCDGEGPIVTGCGSSINLANVYTPDKLD